jgi:hypothetical protein
LKLRRPRSRRQIDALARAVLRGETSLTDAVGIGPEELDAGRAMARHMLLSGHAQRALEVLAALRYFGDAHPMIPLLEAHAFEVLGDRDRMMSSAREAIRTLREAGLETWATKADGHFAKYAAEPPGVDR